MARYLLLHVLVIVSLSEFGEAKNVKKTNFVSKSGKINYPGEELPTPVRNVSYLINPKSFLAYEEQFHKIKSLGADITCKLRGTCDLRKRHKISKKNEKHTNATKKTMQSYANNDIPDNRNQVVSPEAMMGPMTPSMMEAGSYSNQPNAASYGQQPQMDLKIPNMAEGMGMPQQGMPGGREEAEQRANQENDRSIQNAIQSKMAFMDRANAGAMMQMPGAGPEASEGDMGPSSVPFIRHHGSRKEMHAPRGVPNGDSSSINDEDIYKAEGVQPNEMKDLHNFLSNSSQRHKSSEADDEEDDGDKDNRDRADSRDVDDNRDDRDGRYSKDSRHGRGERRPAGVKEEREDEHERPYSSKGHGKESEGNYEGRRHASHRHTHPDPDPDMIPPGMGPPSDIATANDIAPPMLQPLRAGTPEVPTLQNLLGGSMAMPDQGIPTEPSGLSDLPPMGMMQLGNTAGMDQGGRFVSDNNRNMIESNSDYDVPKTGKENTYIAGRRHRHHRSRKHRFHRRHRMHRVQSHHLRDDFHDDDNDPNIAEAQGLMRNFNPMHGISNDTANQHEFADAEQKMMESRANARDRTPADPSKEEKAATSNSSTPTNGSTTTPLTLGNTTAINSTAYNEAIANLTSYINETVKNTTEEINVSLNNNVYNSTLVNRNESAALNNSVTPIEADKKNQSISLNSSLTSAKKVGSKAPSKKSTVAYKPNQPLPPIYLTEKNGEKMLVVHPTAEFLRSLPRINFSSSEDNDKRTVGRQLPPAFLNQDIQIKEESPALRIRDDPADLKDADGDLMEDHKSASNKRSRADIVARSKIFGNGKYISIPVVSPAEANVGEWLREGRNRISTRGRPPFSKNSDTDFSRDFQEQKEDSSHSAPDDGSLSSDFYRDISLHHGGLGKSSRKESIGSKSSFKNADALTVPKEIQNIYQQYAPGQVKSNFNYVPSSDEVSEELKYAQNQLPKYVDKEGNNYGHYSRNSQAESPPKYESEYSNQDYEPDNAAAFLNSWNNKETSEEESKRSETPIVFTRNVGFGPIIVEAKTADAPDDDLDE